MKLLFLADEISSYFLGCLKHLVGDRRWSVMLVRRPIGANFPIKIDEIEGIEQFVLSGNEKEIAATISSFKPDVVIVCGWMHRFYTNICKSHSPATVVICAFDNPWIGSWRQQFGSLYFRGFMRQCYTHAWVPGLRQYEFAKRLGFKNKEILLGLYTADADAFSKCLDARRGSWPKTLLYVGRLVEYKNPHALYDIFHSLSDEERNGWSLCICGAGNLMDRLVPTSICETIGFVQPDHLPNLLSKAGAGILPSDGEHWGVVLHEYACAGLPIVSTDQCAAADSFCIDGYNGIRFDLRQKDSFRKSVIQLCRMSDQELTLWGSRSLELSRQFSPQIWVSRLNALFR